MVCSAAEGAVHSGGGREDPGGKLRRRPARLSMQDAGRHVKERAMNLMWWAEHSSQLELLHFDGCSYPFADVVLPDRDALSSRPSTVGAGYFFKVTSIFITPIIRRIT